MKRKVGVKMKPTILVQSIRDQNFDFLQYYPILQQVNDKTLIHFLNL